MNLEKKKTNMKIEVMGSGLITGENEGSSGSNEAEERCSLIAAEGRRHGGRWI